jgi:hypothetical protein
MDLALNPDRAAVPVDVSDHSPGLQAKGVAIGPEASGHGAQVGSHARKADDHRAIRLEPPLAPGKPRSLCLPRKGIAFDDLETKHIDGAKDQRALISTRSLRSGEEGAGQSSRHCGQQSPGDVHEMSLLVAQYAKRLSVATVLMSIMERRSANAKRLPPGECFSPSAIPARAAHP